MNYREMLETVKKHPISWDAIQHKIRKFTHVHEYEASTFFCDKKECRHNHRFAGVTSEAISVEDGHHIHRYHTNSDTYENHYHFIQGCTGPEIRLPEGKHTHFAEGSTSCDDKHCHCLEFAALIGPSPSTCTKER